MGGEAQFLQIHPKLCFCEILLFQFDLNYFACQEIACCKGKEIVFGAALSLTHSSTSYLVMLYAQQRHNLISKTFDEILLLTLNLKRGKNNPTSSSLR